MNSPRERFRQNKDAIKRHALLVDDSFTESCLDVALSELTWRTRQETGPGVTASGYRLQGAMEFIEIFKALSQSANTSDSSLYDPGALVDTSREVPLKPRSKTIVGTTP